jgi:hypothetical protein
MQTQSSTTSSSQSECDTLQVHCAGFEGENIIYPLLCVLQHFNADPEQYYVIFTK